jgi:hypothetical protein
VSSAITEPNLDESAWQRAKTEAVGVYKSWAFGIALGFMELLAVPASVLLTNHSDDTAIKVAVPVLAGAIAILLAVLAVLAFEIVASPLRQRNELRSALRTMSTDPVPVSLKLQNFRRRGQALLLGIGPTGYTVNDEKAVETWTEATIHFLSEHCDVALAGNFIEASQASPRFITSLENRIAALDVIVEALG